MVAARYRARDSEDGQVAMEWWQGALVGIGSCAFFTGLRAVWRAKHGKEAS